MKRKKKKGRGATPEFPPGEGEKGRVVPYMTPLGEPGGYTLNFPLRKKKGGNPVLGRGYTNIAGGRPLASPLPSAIRGGQVRVLGNPGGGKTHKNGLSKPIGLQRGRGDFVIS